MTTPETPTFRWWQYFKRQRYEAVMLSQQEANAAQERHKPSYCYTITDHGNGVVVWNVWDLHPLVATQVEGYVVPYDHGTVATIDAALEYVKLWVTH